MVLSYFMPVIAELKRKVQYFHHQRTTILVVLHLAFIFAPHFCELRLTTHPPTALPIRSLMQIYWGDGPGQAPNTPALASSVVATYLQTRRTTNQATTLFSDFQPSRDCPAMGHVSILLRPQHANTAPGHFCNCWGRNSKQGQSPAHFSR